MRNAKCVVRNGGRGAQNLEAPQYPFLYNVSRETLYQRSADEIITW